MGEQGAISNCHLEIADAWARGTVVALCGIDGSGKSTLLTGITQRLRATGHQVCATRQPTDSYRQNEHVRAYHDAGRGAMWQEGLALLSAADRLLHLRTVVVPGLLRGEIVISDRFLAATHAIFRARGVDAAWLEEINRYCPPPHLTILLDCPAPVARRRIERRGGYIRLEERSADLLEQIRHCYLEVVPPDAMILDARLPAEELENLATSAVLDHVAARRVTDVTHHGT